MAITMIAYTYRRTDIDARSSISIQGPVYMDDDGRAPWVQAQERVSRMGERRLLSAERVPAPKFDDPSN